MNATYRRLAARRGPAKAIVAIERTLLDLVWSMLTTSALYDEPGPDHYTRHHPERAKNHALRQPANLGYDVTLQPHNGAA